MQTTRTYCEGMLDAFQYLLRNHDDVFLMGQGLWSPWYVGQSMTGLDKEFGRDRVMDTPVSEDASTAIAAGAALSGYRPVIVHPRMDFMVLAANSMVNQIAKWSHMLGGQARPKLTIRAIINRGGEQGAQHSQALHAWYAHIPGLRVVMPATARDARDLLIASVLCDDPVLYIDDRWSYEEEDVMEPIVPIDLASIKPQKLTVGDDITIVGCGYSTTLGKKVVQKLRNARVNAELIDLRVVNPLDVAPVVESVKRTRRLAVIDGSWKNCGMAGEIIASVAENLPPGALRMSPMRFTLPEAPAPTSGPLEANYYLKADNISQSILTQIETSFSVTNH